MHTLHELAYRCSYTLLDPEWLLAALKTWLGTTDELGVPSYWGYWGYDEMAQRGIGNYYAANDFTLSQSIHSLLRVSANLSTLNTTLHVKAFNGTVVSEASFFEVLASLANHWRSMNASEGLADYGGAPNLLECVPSYINRVASCNAANAWMMNELASILSDAASPRYDPSRAAALQKDADMVAQAVLGLYHPRSNVSGGGYFDAIFLNGTRQEVRTIMDFTYVTQFLGVEGRSGYIPPGVANEMTEFVVRELLTDNWMRALSVSDPFANFSNRSDHGPSGAYCGWPAMTMSAMGRQGKYAEASAFLNRTEYVTTLGPYGQAVEVRPPGLPYKPFDVTLYIEASGFSFAETIVTTLFGYQPPMPRAATDPAAPNGEPIADASAARGFVGKLSGVRWGQRLVDISSGPAGLTWEFRSERGRD